MRWNYQTLLGSYVPEDFIDEPQRVLLAHTIQFHEPGRLVGMRYYRHKSVAAAPIAIVKQSRSADQIERIALFKDRDAGDGPDEGEWQNAYFHPMLRIAAEDYRCCMVLFRFGNYWRTLHGFDSAIVSGDLEAPADADPERNGAFDYTGDWYPTDGYQASLYGIDVLFLADHQVTG